MLTNMAFDLAATTDLLKRTPATLQNWLGGLPAEWIESREKPEGWNAFEIVGHLIHGEETDWIPRMRGILKGGESAKFEPFDRAGHGPICVGKSMTDLLGEFADWRAQNLRELGEHRLGPAKFAKVGYHPNFGAVRLDQLLAAWAVHDLSHTSQVARAMARHHREAVGPWQEFMPIVGPRD